jgi:type VI secretion system lysozyme-like protein
MQGPDSDREPKPIQGGKPNLFERLTDLDPASQHESVPFRILGQEELRQSVRREVVCLLNTRSSRPLDFQGDDELTVLDYGIPDFSSLSAANDADRKRLAAILVRVLSAFEPRLGRIEVTFATAPGSQTSLLGQIHAVMEVGWVKEPVSFPVVFETKTGAAELLDD